MDYFFAMSNIIHSYEYRGKKYIQGQPAVRAVWDCTKETCNYLAHLLTFLYQVYCLNATYIEIILDIYIATRLTFNIYQVGIFIY